MWYMIFFLLFGVLYVECYNIFGFQSKNNLSMQPLPYFRRKVEGTLGEDTGEKSSIEKDPTGKIVSVFERNVKEVFDDFDHYQEKTLTENQREERAKNLADTQRRTNFDVLERSRYLKQDSLDSSLDPLVSYRKTLRDKINSEEIKHESSEYLETQQNSDHIRGGQKRRKFKDIPQIIPNIVEGLENLRLRAESLDSLNNHENKETSNKQNSIVDTYVSNKLDEQENRKYAQNVDYKPEKVQIKNRQQNIQNRKESFRQEADENIHDKIRPFIVQGSKKENLASAKMPDSINPLKMDLSYLSGLFTQTPKSVINNQTILDFNNIDIEKMFQGSTLLFSPLRTTSKTVLNLVTDFYLSIEDLTNLTQNPRLFQFDQKDRKFTTVPMQTLPFLINKNMSQPIRTSSPHVTRTTEAVIVTVKTNPNVNITADTTGNTSIFSGGQDYFGIDEIDQKRSCILCDNVRVDWCSLPKHKLIPSIVCEHENDLCYSMHTPFGIVDRGCFSLIYNISTYVCECNLCNHISFYDLPMIFASKRDWIQNVYELSHLRRLRKTVHKDLDCLRCEVNASSKRDPIYTKHCLEGHVDLMESVKCAEDEICGISAITSTGYLSRGCFKTPLYNYYITLCDTDLCNYDPIASIFDPA